MSTRYDGTSRFCTISGPEITYFVRVADPTPDTPVRSIDTTRLGEPKSGSGARRVPIFAVPENETLSGVPLTVPLTDTRLVFHGRITCAGACATHSAPPAKAAAAARTPPFNNVRRVFMSFS